MSIYKKLFEAKKEIGKISKDSKNPFYKSKYFDINQLLEHVEPILQKHDLLLLQPIVNNKQQTVIIDIETGEKEISEIELTNITDPQKRGSEITYYRRYTATSLLGLQAEDDDANKTVTPYKMWISQKQVQQAIDGGVETINKTLAYYDNKTVRDTDNGKRIYCMSDAFKKSLETALKV